MKPAISQVCSLPSPWEKDLEEYAAAACSAVEIWLGKLEGFLENHSPADARETVAKHGLELAAASYQGGLFDERPLAQEEHRGHFSRRLKLCRELNVPTLVVACDAVGKVDFELIRRMRGTLVEIAKEAGDHGVRLALEFQARSVFGNNLETAAALVDECDHPALGLCLDAFHFFTGPSKSEDLIYLHPGNLYHVQLCDLSGPTRELAQDGDRILPGDGDLPLAPLIERLKQIGYAGFVSVELMNGQLWQIPPRQFGEVAMTALRKLLGQAGME